MEATVALYERELDSLLGYADQPCRSGRFECFLATDAFDSWWDDTNRQFNRIWAQSAKAPGSAVRSGCVVALRPMLRFSRMGVLHRAMDMASGIALDDARTGGMRRWMKD